MGRKDANRLLVVSPNRERRSRLQRVLRESKFDLAESASQADLVLVDLRDPKSVRALRGELNEQRLPVIALVDFRDAASLKRLRAVRASEFISEATLEQELAIRARQAAERHRHQSEARRRERLLEFNRDQAEREKSAREAAERRSAQLERYESYFAHVSEGMAILDRNSLILSLNPAGAALLDVTTLDARGKHINELTNPIEDSVLLQALYAASQGETRRAIDIAGHTVTGQRITLSISAAALAEDGSSVILSFREVTAEREVGLELRKTKDFLERLFDSSVDGIVSADMEGNILLYNKGAQVICGWTPAEARKLNIRELFASPETAQEMMVRLRQGNGRVGVTRQEMLAKTKQKVPVNTTASIIYDGTREIATVAIFTDIRERVQLEQQLSAAKNRLGEAEKNAVIVALAGAAAHELNQPLTSVMGYAELLRRRLEPGDFAFRPVDTIYREAERMAEIVRKIGKITRYETKAYVGEAKILDLDKATSHEE